MSNIFLKFGDKSIAKVGSNIMGFDSYPQASQFISVANITDSTQQIAINYLVKELVDNNLMSKFNFIYPMVGGDATRHSYNLINPNLYQLTFSGGWVHSSNGSTPNGTNAFANSGFKPNSIIGDDIHYSYYSRTDSNPLNEVVIGSGDSTTLNYFTIRDHINRLRIVSFSSESNQAISPNTNGLGFYIANIQSVSLRQIIKNGAIINSNTVNQNTLKSSTNLYIGAYNSNGTTVSFSNKQCAFVSIGNGMTNSEITIFNNIVQQFQIILGRNV